MGAVSLGIPGVMMLVLLLRVVSLVLLVAQVVQHPALPQQSASISDGSNRHPDLPQQAEGGKKEKGHHVAELCRNRRNRHSALPQQAKLALIRDGSESAQRPRRRSCVTAPHSCANDVDRCTRQERGKGS